METRERDKLKVSFKNVGVGWPLNPGRRWVADTMGNDKAIKLLIEYLEATEIGGREGANRRSEKWGDRDEEDELDSKKSTLSLSWK